MGQNDVYQALKKSKIPLSVQELTEQMKGETLSCVHRSCRIMFKRKEIKRKVVKEPIPGRNGSVRFVSTSKYYIDEENK